MKDTSKTNKVQKLYEQIETQVYIDNYKIKQHEKLLSEDQSFQGLKDEIINRKGDSYFDVLMLKESSIDKLRRVVRSLRLKEYMSVGGDKKYPNYDINIPEDKLLLFHNTTQENAENIAFEGLKASAGKDQNRGKDGDFVWGTTVKNAKGYGGYTIAFVIDKKKAEPYKVNDTEYTLPFDIPSEDIVFIDEPIGLNNYRESDIKALIDKYGEDKVAEVLSTKTNFDMDAIGLMISRSLNEDFDPGYGLSRSDLISKLKELGKNYNFDRFKTEQLYHIYNKAIKSGKPGIDDFLDSDDYREIMTQLDREKQHPLYKRGKNGETYIRTDSGRYEKLDETEKLTRDVLNRNPVKLSTYWDDSNGITQHNEREFSSVKELFNWIKDCGGFASAFDGIRWFIVSEYEGGEYYLVRDRFAKGGWHWEDCNGNLIDMQYKEVKHSGLEESEKLDEKSLLDLIDDSKATDPKRIELAKTIYTNYKGVDSDGTLLFESDSQSRSSLVHRQRVFYPGFFDLLDTVDAGDEITEEQVVDIITGDLMVDCSCFTGETLISVPGGFKYLRDIEVGDSVLTHTGKYRKVLKVFEPREDDIIKVSIGTRELFCTSNHPFLTVDGRWVPIKDCENEELVCFEIASNTLSPIGKPVIEYIDEKAIVYNIEVEEDNSYCVGHNRVVVHNCESFLYYAWAYKSWTGDYGLMKELRAPQKNNIELKGGACKHVLSVLDLLNRSNTLFDQVARDLNILFQKYKKRTPNTNKEEVPTEEQPEESTGE